jgi:hypothetical protein
MMENENNMQSGKPELPRLPGGQPGNQNARTHGFYSRVLTSDQQAQLQQARDLRGVDEEIAMLRVKIQSILENDPDNSAVLLRAVTALTRLVKVRCLRSEDDEAHGIAAALRNVYQGIAAPAGIPAEQFFAMQEKDTQEDGDGLR